MIQQIQLTLLPEQCHDDVGLRQSMERSIRLEPGELRGFRILKKSLDARRKPVRFNLLVELYIGEDPVVDDFELQLQDVSKAREVAIIGAGPAGMFAALRLIELGIRPVIFERGKEVRERRRDLAKITRENKVDPDSNYCFGEGGAGTYSDGKLYTRSSKRGDVQRILKILVMHGADPDILYEAHPHIGTNRLPQIITAIRETIERCGGVFHFNSRITDLRIQDQSIRGIYVSENFFPFTQVILATGHSARDIYELLHRHNILIEAKPFALGVRVEHPQELIDQIQYKCGLDRGPYLPAASYSLVEQVQGKGVFSFCMCPGGIIAPAMTAAGEIVVNGWSPSKRNNPYANSGIVVSVQPEDYAEFSVQGPLAGMYFQQRVEQNCFEMGNKSLKAPAQRLTDFVQQKTSSTLPHNSYLPGTISRNLNHILPPFVANRLREGFLHFGNKMKGYLTQDALVVGTESRTSSPVRIPRDKTNYEHPQLKGLFPAAEGAGYAGGIVSAAMDGENCAFAACRVKSRFPSNKH